jgi:regulator of extracellular matrix RemA (YlzA/DUF370 family)
MYIHIGNRQIVSDRDIVGIFNPATMRLSEENRRYFEHLSDSRVKALVVDKKDYVLTSWVSSFTIIKRTPSDNDFLWRRNND